jgi:hypothetical protein
LDRPLKLLLTVVVAAAAPTASLAQVWPVSVVAAGPRMAQAPAQALVRIERDGRLLRPRLEVPRTPPQLKLTAVDVDDEVPEVDIRAKEAWLDDQGLRVSPTRLAFKRRF